MSLLMFLTRASNERIVVLVKSGAIRRKRRPREPGPSSGDMDLGSKLKSASVQKVGCDFLELLAFVNTLSFLKFTR